jgi:5S rRNA maturation endonuclease (ribonuclease M5)
LALPEHTQNVNKFSPNVLKWLYSFYVYDDLIRKYGIAYSEYAEFGQFKGESLILPVIVDGDLKSYQRRFFPHKQFLTKGDKTSPFIIKCVGSNQMVLVEDYISAIRVGQFCNVVCLQGVHIQWNALKLIENSNMDIIIWLDPDEAGQTAAKDLEQRLVNRLQLGSRYKAFSFREPRAISILQTGKQPKDYCDIELQKIIGEYKCLNQ